MLGGGRSGYLIAATIRFPRDPDERAANRVRITPSG
jgi:hypothetical protein